MDIDPDKRTLYVGNLDKNVTEEVLYELFLQAGPVERVNICGNNDSFRYGFVTYKHDVSIEYALQLYKGINLFKREILIKRKGTRPNNNQQPNDFVKHGGQEEVHKKANVDFNDIADGLRAYIQQRANSDAKHLFPPVPPVKGNWSNRKKPYDRNPRNHFSRFRESRDRHKDKNYGNKMHHNRKNRH